MPDIGVSSTITSTLRTYLDLVRRLASEVGVSKDPVTTIPTLAGVIGETRRLADWIATAWKELQQVHPNWQFMRASFSFTTIDGQAIYTPAQCGITLGTFGSWERESLRSYLTSIGTIGEIPMRYIPYDDWRNHYQLGGFRTSKSQPFVNTTTPNKSLGLGPVPLAGYTVLGDYYVAPVELLVDGDVPALPLEHDKMIIVYKAMEDHGFFEAASEVIGRSRAKYPRLLRRLEQDYAPQMYGPGPLA